MVPDRGTEGGECDSPRSRMGEIGVRPVKELEVVIFIPPIARLMRAVSADKSGLSSASSGAIPDQEVAISAVDP